ncbi:MAG: hypothetical protein LUG85_07840 [Clostridiales bacterium]|nr:hypothetical protein [Clostridiales bacterium]
MEDFLSIADTIQVLFWSLTYVLIIVFSIKHWDELKKEKKILIPITASMFNIAWEINAFVESKGMWGHVLWLGLDIIIVLFNIYIYIYAIFRKVLRHILSCDNSRHHRITFCF